MLPVVYGLGEALINPSGMYQGRLFQTCLRGQARLCHLGGLFQTPLYHLHPCKRASMRARARKEKIAFPPCFKINDLCRCQVMRAGAAPPCAAKNLCINQKRLKV